MKSKLRVAVLANRFPEVSETFVMDQFRGLLRHGFDAHMYADPPREGKGAPGWEHSEELRQRIHWYPAPVSTRALRLPFALVQAARDGQLGLAARVLAKGGYGRPRWAAVLEALPFVQAPAPDVVHAQFGPNGLRALRLEKLGAIPPETPLVVTFHGYDVNRSPLRYGKAMYQELFAKAAALTCGSRFIADTLAEMGAPRQKLHVIPMGVDTNVFAPENSRFRDRGDKESLQIVTVSRLAVEKGITVAIEALARLLQLGVAAHWTFVGDGPLHAELEEHAVRLDVREHVTFAGAKGHEDIPSLLQRADVLVLPSIYSPDGNIEGQGLVLAEAQACSLPVVASRVGGIPESLCEGETGFLVPPQDPERLANALARLAKDVQLRFEMGKAARTFVVKNFDQAQLRQQFAELLRNCALPRD